MKFANTTVEAADGTPYRLHNQETGVVDVASVGSMITLLCMSLRDLSPMTMLDAQQALRIVRKVRQSNGHIELDPGDHKWLLKAVDDFSPRLYGVTAAALREKITEDAGE